MRRIRLLRGLVPNRSHYGGRGYGALLLPAEAASSYFDSSLKDINVEQLPPPWLKRWNGVLLGLLELQLRPTTWRAFADNILSYRRRLLSCLQQLKYGQDAFFANGGLIFDRYIDRVAWQGCATDASSSVFLPCVAVDEWGYAAEGMDESAWMPSPRSSPRRSNRTFMRNWKDFCLHMGNFCWQAQTLLDVIPLVAQQNLRADIKVLQSTMEAIGGNEQSVPSSIYNITHALLLVNAMQREFRTLFGHYYPGNELRALEQEEQIVYPRVCDNWFWLLHAPNQRTPTASRDHQRLLKRTVEQIFSELKRIVKEFSQHHNIQANTFTDILGWNEKPTFWIVIDSQDAVTIQNAGQALFGLIRDSLYQLGHGDAFILHAIQVRCEQVAIVPLILGKSLTGEAWLLDGATTVAQEQLSEVQWWEALQQSIPIICQQQLGIEKYQHPELEMVQSFWRSSIELWQLAKHGSSLNKLPFDRMDDLSREIITKYFEELVIRVGNLLTALYAVMGVMINQISEQDVEEMGFLLEGGRALVEWEKCMKPGGKQGDEFQVSLEEFEEWATKVEQNLRFATVAYLCWASHIIARITVGA